MIKSKVVNKNSVSDPINVYPCVGISDYGTIVLFASTSCGVTLHVSDSSSFNVVGKYSTAWVMDKFTLLPKDKYVEIGNA